MGNLKTPVSPPCPSRNTPQPACLQLDDAISVMKDHVEGLEDTPLLHVPPEDFITDNIPVSETPLLYINCYLYSIPWPLDDRFSFRTMFFREGTLTTH